MAQDVWGWCTCFHSENCFVTCTYTYVNHNQNVKATDKIINACGLWADKPVFLVLYCCFSSWAILLWCTSWLFRATHNFVRVGDGGVRCSHLESTSLRKDAGPPIIRIGAVSILSRSFDDSPSCRPIALHWLAMGWRCSLRKSRSP